MTVTPKSQMLSKLQMRTANPELARRDKESRLIGTQQQISKLPVAGRGQPQVGVREAQQMGGAQAKAGGQSALQEAQTTAQTATRTGQLALGADEQKHREQLTQKQNQLSRASRANEERISKLGEGVKDRLLDKRMEFQRDEAGRALLNDYQWQDLAAMKANNAEEFKDLQQDMHQAQKNYELMLRKQHELLSNALRDDFRIKGRELDQKTKIHILKLKRDTEARMKAEAARRANKRAAAGAIGTMGGAVVGTMIAPGAGTAAGGAFGGAAATGAVDAGYV